MDGGYLSYPPHNIIISKMAILYRVHINLHSACDIDYPRGEISTLDSISQKGINKLLDRGAITQVITPPLWVVISDADLVTALNDVGIEDVVTLLCMDIGELSEQLEMTPEVLNSMIKQIKVYLEPNKPAKPRR